MAIRSVYHRRGVSLWASVAVLGGFTVGFVNPPTIANQDSETQQNASGTEDEEHRSSDMDEEERIAAGRRAIELIESFKAIDRENETYPSELIEELWAFYDYGIGTENEPGDSLVTSMVCREFVLALIWDLFLVEESSENGSAPDTSGFRNALDKASATLFLELFTHMLSSADKELSFLQRTRLYRVAGLALHR